jgi:hypothetical protein
MTRKIRPVLTTAAAGVLLMGLACTGTAAQAATAAPQVTECQVLQNELKVLQAELFTASSSQKPAIIREIVAIETKMEQLGC